MELNYITYIQENLASFFDFVAHPLFVSFEANQPANFHKYVPSRIVNLYSKRSPICTPSLYSNLYCKRSKLAMQLSSSKTLK